MRTRPKAERSWSTSRLPNGFSAATPWVGGSAMSTGAEARRRKMRNPGVAKRKPDRAHPQFAKRKPDRAQPQVAKRKPDRAQPQVAKRKPDRAQPQDGTRSSVSSAISPLV